MKKRLIASVIVIVVVAVCTWLLLRWANSPVTQRVISTDIANQTDANETIDITTDYYRTKLPADYRVELNPNPNDATMLQLSAFPSDDGRVQVGITTALLPTDGLNGVADYIYRIKQTATYIPISTTVFSGDSHEFQKQGGGELSAFVINGGRYASITVSGEGTTDDDLRVVQQLIAANWNWL